MQVEQIGDFPQLSLQPRTPLRVTYFSVAGYSWRFSLFRQSHAAVTCEHGTTLNDKLDSTNLTSNRGEMRRRRSYLRLRFHHYHMTVPALPQLFAAFSASCTFALGRHAGSGASPHAREVTYLAIYLSFVAHVGLSVGCPP